MGRTTFWLIKKDHYTNQLKLAKNIIVIQSILINFKIFYTDTVVKI